MPGVLSDVLAAEPTLTAQGAGLLVGMVAVLIFMRVGTSIMTRAIKSFARLRKSKVKDLTETFAGIRVDMGDPETDFKEFCQGAGGHEDFAAWRKRKADEIAAADNLTNHKSATDLLKNKHAIDAYVDESELHSRLITDFACHRGAKQFMLMLQHAIAGTFGLAALCASDQDTFVWLARWGMLFEAGWELNDWLFNIIPNIWKGNGLKMLPMILHHFCLYSLLPVNLYYIQGPIGREVAWSLVLFAGTFGPLVILLNVAECLDVENPKEIPASLLLGSMVIAMILITRGPAWWWLAYSFITKSAQISKSLNMFFWALVVFFQLFNLIFYAMCVIFVTQMIKIVKGMDTEAERKDKVAFGIALRALLNPAAFAIARQQQRAQTNWTKIRAVHKLGMFGKKTSEKKA